MRQWDIEYNAGGTNKNVEEDVNSINPYFLLVLEGSRLRGETTEGRGPTPLTFPLLKTLDEARIWLHARPFAFDERVCGVKGHAPIPDEVRDDNRCAARDAL
jgi:hypothetical protein